MTARKRSRSMTARARSRSMDSLAARFRRIAGAGLVGLGVLLASTRPVPAPESTREASSAIKAGYDKAASELLCYCGCSRLTIKECTCSVAFQLRDQMEAKLAGGESADSIIADYIREHGEQSRSAPPRKGLNLVAWFGPAVMILVAGSVMTAVLVYRLSHRTGSLAPAAAEGSEGGGASPVANNDRDAQARRKLEDALREIDL